MLSVENEVLDVEGLNPEENAKDGHSLNIGSELTSKFTGASYSVSPSALGPDISLPKNMFSG